MEKSQNLIFVDGYLQRDNGSRIGHVAPIATDKTLKVPELREMFHPGALVQYFPEGIIQEDMKTDAEQVFIPVVDCNCPSSGQKFVPLFMLSLTPQQKKELRCRCKLPRRVFEKYPVAATVDPPEEGAEEIPYEYEDYVN